MTTAIKPPAWTLRAACAEIDGELFYPEAGENSRPAKIICSGCPVRVQCLTHALTTQEPFGVMGGFSARERQRIRTALGMPNVCRTCRAEPVREPGMHLCDGCLSRAYPEDAA